MSLLSNNTELITTHSKCKIQSFIGSGGQGEVYKATYNRKDVAVKWYYKNTATPEQRKILTYLVKTGAPNEKYLWPMELVQNAKSFGYIMRLRPNEYKKITDLMKRRIDPTFRELITAGIYLSDSFFQLHAKGLCYRDISYNNIFINPDTGDILICDNDNVTTADTVTKTILGTPRFMAPEVVVGHSLPNKYSDLFSLGVLLFYMLFISHPLEGKLESDIRCMDSPAMEKLYGKNPVFIFDPNNATNRPVPGIHDNAMIYWNLYPSYIKDAFTKVFTTGLKDRENGRVVETVWRKLLSKLRDSILYCTCGAENFYDLEAIQKQGHINKCWACGKEIVLPPRIKIGNKIIMLNHDTKLYSHHLDDKAWNFHKPIAEVVSNPTNPAIWGLKNLRDESFFVTIGGSVTEIAKGKTQRIIKDSTINFGQATGEIK